MLPQERVNYYNQNIEKWKGTVFQNELEKLYTSDREVAIDCLIALNNTKKYILSSKNSIKNLSVTENDLLEISFNIVRYSMIRNIFYDVQVDYPDDSFHTIQWSVDKDQEKYDSYHLSLHKIRFNCRDREIFPRLLSLNGPILSEELRQHILHSIALEIAGKSDIEKINKIYRLSFSSVERISSLQEIFNISGNMYNKFSRGEINTIICPTSTFIALTSHPMFVRAPQNQFSLLRLEGHINKIAIYHAFGSNIPENQFLMAYGQTSDNPPEAYAFGTFLNLKFDPEDRSKTFIVDDFVPIERGFVQIGQLVYSRNKFKNWLITTWNKTFKKKIRLRLH